MNIFNYFGISITTILWIISILEEDRKSHRAVNLVLWPLITFLLLKR